MILRPAKRRPPFLAALMVCLGLTGRLLASPTGPTLQFDLGDGQPVDNPLTQFMYFVPLISPELVSMVTNAGNAQCARVQAVHAQIVGNWFHVTREFDFRGEGWQRNVFDHAGALRRHEADLRAGKPILHQIASINVEGPGTGTVEINGTVTNNHFVVTEMRMRFNSRGHTSPVTINLQDLAYRDGSIQPENEVVARVNSLFFFQKAGLPKMEVTLASVKRKDAADSLWQNFVGGLKGAAANLFLPPLTVTTDGYQAMMDFGLALATARPAFTFPFATRLTSRIPADPQLTPHRAAEIRR